MTKLDSILKNKDINLLTKVHIVKAMVFSVVMNGWGNWTKETKKRRLKPEELILSNCGAGEDLRVPWILCRLNWSVLKEINPKYSLKGLLLKLKF